MKECIGDWQKKPKSKKYKSNQKFPVWLPPPSKGLDTDCFSGLLNKPDDPYMGKEL